MDKIFVVQRKKPIVVRRLSSADRWRNGTIQNSAERDLYEEENDEENKRGRSMNILFILMFLCSLLRGRKCKVIIL